MDDGIHVDYETIMGKEKEGLTFNAVYEKAIDNMASDTGASKELMSKLKEKREYGFKKYGEHSFQGTFENCITSPTIEHAKEEAIDFINYLLHEMYKNKLLGNEKDNIIIRQLLESSYIMYHTLCSINHK